LRRDDLNKQGDTMPFMRSRKRSAWDQIKAAVAEAASVAGDKAADLRDAAVDAEHRVHARVKDTVGHGWDSVQGGVHAGADAVRTGAAAVGHGVAVVDQKVEDVANGILAGAIAGALASWVMNQFQAVSAKPVARRNQEATQPPAPSEDNATTKAAEALVGHPLAADQKPVAGAAVHYGYGAAMGALYGGLAEIVPSVGMGLGIPYATALWLFGDEVAVPALGLGKPPTASTPAEHAGALSAHFVYGLTLDVARRVLRHIV
jgi:putative membrane protein